MSTSTLRIPVQTEQVRVARLVAGSAARRAGVVEDDVEDVRLAVGEAVGRAVVRHLHSQVSDPVVIEFVGAAESFTVVVRDRADDALPDNEFTMAVITGLAPESVLAEHTVSLTWYL